MLSGSGSERERDCAFFGVANTTQPLFWFDLIESNNKLARLIEITEDTSRPKPDSGLSIYIEISSMVFDEKQQIDLSGRRFSYALTCVCVFCIEEIGRQDEE